MTALVTGGGSGIGRAIALRLARRDDRVVAVGRSRGALEETASRAEGRIEVQVCDVTREDEVGALFSRVAPVDVLVNNAGAATSAPLVRTSLADWSDQLAVNATGAFLCTRAALPAMVERDRGRIVIVASTAGLVGYPYTAGYTASKHAAVGLMRAVASEFAGTGVTANAVCPAFVDTEMTRSSVARIVQATGRSELEATAALAGSSPLGRLLAPEEVAAAVEFLVSEKATSINGQTLVLDGGGIQR
jgi:NAD(P)-dependent dehydrogenase (short-subunit alcohol dehydrogenase family)